MPREPNALKLALAVIAAFMLLAASVAGSYALALSAIDRSQHKWCSTLSLLTTDAHPPTAGGKVFYGKLRDLEHRFGCL